MSVHTAPDFSNTRHIKAPSCHERSCFFDLIRVSFLVLAVSLSYYPVLEAGTIWDDKAVFDNPAIRDPDGLRKIWLEPASLRPFEIHYWPMVYTSFWIEYRFWGDTPQGYHIINVVLHLVNSLLIWRIGRKLLLPGSWAAAMIFGLHPVHVESVAWIMERKDVLSALFFLIAVNQYDRFLLNKSGLNYTLSLMAYLCGLLSKSIVITLPVTLFLISRFRMKSRSEAFALIPFLLIGAIHTVFDLIFSSGIELMDFSLSLGEKFIIAGRSLWFYVIKLVYPANLMVIYPRWKVDPNQMAQYGYVILYAGMLGILWTFRKKWGMHWSAFALFYTITLIPVLGFVPFGYMRYAYVADRFQYLASAGPIFISILVYDRIVNRFNPSLAIQIVIPVFVFGILGVRTWNQSTHYQNKDTLFRYVITKNPDAYIAHYNLASEAANRDDYQTAMRHYLEVYRIKPLHGDTLMQLGTAMLQLRRWTEAEKYLSMDIANRPWNVNSHLNQGNARLHLGNIDGAIQSYRNALQLDAMNAKAHNNLGFCLAEQGMENEALDHYRKSLIQDPESQETLLNLARLLHHSNLTSEAAIHYRKLLQLNPSHLESANNLAWILATSPDDHLRNAEEAIHWAEHACRLTQWDDPDCLDTLGVAYFEAGRIEEARNTAHRALEISIQKGREDSQDVIQSHIDRFESGRRSQEAVPGDPTSIDPSEP